jgi:hypothetical protein
MEKACIRVCLDPGRPKREAMEVVDERKYRRRMGINLNRYLNAVRSRQCETDYDQQRK